MGGVAGGPDAGAPGDGDAPSIDHGEVEGAPTVVLRAGGYEATFVPSVGMLGSSLRRRGRELLTFTGLAGYRNGHVTALPLLHPWANRLGSSTYQLGSTWVDVEHEPPVHLNNGLPIHGTLVAAAGWQIEAEIADGTRAMLQARYDFGHHPEQLRSFPFPHDIVLFAELSDLGLRLTTTIANTGPGVVPVSFGWHPYLQLDGVPRRELALDLPAREHLELDLRMLPTGASVVEPAVTLALGDGSREVTLDDSYRLGPGGDDRRFALRRIAGGHLGTDPGGGTDDAERVVMDMVDGYTYAQLYAPTNQAFVAIEPMTAPVNALVTGEHRDVEPGSSFSATFTVHAEGL
jgi:galactose mutarotase-like enzyme